MSDDLDKLRPLLPGASDPPAQALQWTYRQDLPGSVWHLFEGSLEEVTSFPFPEWTVCGVLSMGDRRSKASREQPGPPDFVCSACIVAARRRGLVL